MFKSKIYGWLDYGVYRHFQQYFSHIVVVSFIGGGNGIRGEYHRHNVVSSTPRHE